MVDISFAPRPPEIVETAAKLAESRGLARRIRVDAGHVFFNKNDVRDVAYIIEEGEVDIKNENDAVLATLNAGEIFGEMALIDAGQRSATCVAKTETAVFILSREILRERMTNLDPLVGMLIGLLVEHYRVAQMHLPESLKQTAEDNAHMAVRQNTLDTNFLPVQSIQFHQNKALQELKVEQELRLGLERREFEPFLQPILDLKSRRVTGFESLIRWRHPVRGLVFPDEFIPIAERTNVVELLDQLMLEKACEVAPIINEVAGNSRGPLYIGVNLSGVNFSNTSLADKVQDIVDQAGIPYHQIRLEITESALIGDADAAQEQLIALKQAGFGISLDDFGTGYSSLSYLHKFSFDTLKIDRAFVMQMSAMDAKGHNMIRAIINLAQDFGLYTVAEGIESETDAELLRAMGCTKGQGYFFGRPVDVNATKKFLQEYKP